MFNKITIKDMKVTGKRVLLRADFNVPLNSNHQITNDKRIRESLPTIKYLLNEGAKIILCSHLGRPEGKYNPDYSMQPVADRLRELLKKPIYLAKDVAGPDTFKLVRTLKDGDIILLENLRFEPGEEENSLDFAKNLASIADIYCNDAFGTMHRAHASTSKIAELLPSCTGLLVEKELNVLGKTLNSPERPFVVITGGVKIKDKINLLSNLVENADIIMIGGAMAYTFMKAQGYNVGKSMVEKDKVPLAKLLLEKAENCGTKIILPVDNVVTKEFNFAAESIIVPTDNIPRNAIGMDIGPKTVAKFRHYITRAKTVFWNGPMGVFEFQKFAKGTNSIAKAMASTSATTIVGGGDSAFAIESLELQDKISHVSTGGGAALKFLEGAVLPGLEAIKEKVM
ncbi:MAG: phosphoglycerate kinase [Clostridia bacterium]|nr:phosphoglycerate kinase [Clostridia bacterium]